MLIQLQQWKKSQIYSALSQTIIPRPIAWVLSDNGNNSYNLAPFSFFNGVSSDPPLIILSVGKKKDGTKKDTWVNIEERGHFLIHIPSCEFADMVSATSKPLPFGVSEITELNLKTTTIRDWALPVVAGIKVVYKCNKYKIFEIGNGPQGLILGQVESMFIDDSIGSLEKGILSIDTKKWNPLARLGRDEYASLGNLFSLERPG